MPRENRKRGKKNKTNKTEVTRENEYYDRPAISPQEDEPQEAPIRECGAEGSPFGVLDPDVKAYFRTVDDQLREWQEGRPYEDMDTDANPNEERRLFFTAALSEMNGKELQLATDPDCSPILERMLYSMDDYVRRVFTDSLAGSWLQLVSNRFASHVCQSLFTVAAETVTRETCGIFPTLPTSGDNRGELRTMTQLIMNACEDIILELHTLIQDPFGSHVLRSLLLLLAPSQFASTQSRSHRHVPSARSKKSAMWKARRGPMKAVIDMQPGSREVVEDKRHLQIPKSFTQMAVRFVDQIRSKLGGNEMRALAVDKVASPSLQMLLELETSAGKADTASSITDHVLTGLVTDIHSSVNSSASFYVNSLIRDITSSHLVECIFSCSLKDVCDRLWDCYIHDELPKLALHPVANFVVARGVGRLDETRLRDALAQLESTWRRSFELSRLGVLTAMVDRARQVRAYEAEIVNTICSMVGATTDVERKRLVPCLLYLKNYMDMRAGEYDTFNGTEAPRGDGSRNQVAIEPKIQGSFLLQSLLQLHEPHNHIILESLLSLSPAELLTLAQNATSSRILDVALESPTVPLRSRKRLVTAFIEHYHVLVDDRIGSRVADRCWEAADPYLKEKIARSLIPHEQFLVGSHFGRFFSRNVNLPLLQRKPDLWKALQSKARPLVTDANAIPTAQGKLSHSPVIGAEDSAAVALSDPKLSSKRKRRNIADGDEIDALFSGIGAKKRAKRITDTTTGPAPEPEGDSTVHNRDATLETILGAIKAAPKELRRNKK